MERHLTTAILISCPTCGLIRMADNYASAHARGNAHISFSGHPKIDYSQIDAPDRIKGAVAEAKASMESMAVQAGVKDISIEAGIEPDIALRR